MLIATSISRSFSDKTFQVAGYIKGAEEGDVWQGRDYSARHNAQNDTLCDEA